MERHCFVSALWGSSSGLGRSGHAPEEGLAPDRASLHATARPERGENAADDLAAQIVVPLFKGKNPNIFQGSECWLFSFCC